MKRKYSPVARTQIIAALPMAGHDELFRVGIRIEMELMADPENEDLQWLVGVLRAERDRRVAARLGTSLN